MNGKKARAIRRIANLHVNNKHLVDQLNSMCMDVNLLRQAQGALSVSMGAAAFYKNIKNGYKLLRKNQYVKDGMNVTLSNFSNTGFWVNPLFKDKLAEQALTFIHMVGNYMAIRARGNK